MANRRLAIVDLTPAGHQPMCNEDGTIWIVYNGELYNAAELRAELTSLGHRFVSGSDTEAIVHAYETWGDACFARFNGMWGLAIWDIPRRRLMLVARPHGHQAALSLAGRGALRVRVGDQGAAGPGPAPPRQ